MGRGLAFALGAALVVSLSLNLFALGHISGRMLAGGVHDGPPPPIHGEGRGPRGGFEDPFRILRASEDLSPELRGRFRDSFREELPKMREAYRAMGGLRRELGEMMSAEEWDDAAISAKLDEIESLEDKQKRVFVDAFLSVFKELPAEERKALIDAANDRRAEWRERRRDRRDDRGGPDGPPPDGPPPGEPGFAPDGDMPPPPPPED